MEETHIASDKGKNVNAAYLRELQMQFEYLAAQIEDGKRQLAETRLSLSEMQETLLAIAELETKPKSTMVSIGANAFAQAKIESEKIMVTVGSNVLAAKKPIDARAILEQRAAKLMESVQVLEKALAQMLQARQQLAAQFQQMQLGDGS